MFLWKCEEKANTTATQEAVWHLWSNLDTWKDLVAMAENLSVKN